MTIIRFHIKTKWLLSLFVLLVFCLIAMNLWIVGATKSQLFRNPELIPFQEVGLVLGTRPFMPNGRGNLFFHNRMKTAAALFRAGKIKTLILSGDKHYPAYNEPLEMKKALIKLGVPEAVIQLDPGGFDTITSIRNAHTHFHANSMTIISQKNHLQRALFISRAEGVPALGLIAEPSGVIGNDLRIAIREQGARVKALFEIFL